MPGISAVKTGIPFSKKGINWSSYWATRNPSALVLTVLSSTSIKLDWTANGVQDYDGHSVERSADGVTYVEVDTVTVGTNTFTDTGLTAGTLYYYRVKAYKGSNQSTASNVEYVYSHILHDEFITADDAPMTSPRTCEPGGGTLVITDAANIMSVAGGSLVINGTASGTNTGFISGDAYARAAGLTMAMGVNSMANGGLGRFGLASTFGASVINGARIAATSINPSEEYVNPGMPATYPNMNFVVQRATGSFLINGTKLIWVSRTNNTSNQKPEIWFSAGQAPNINLTSLIVTKLKDFEDDTKLYTHFDATPTTGDIAVQTADALISFDWTVGANETFELMFRRVDDANTLILRCSQSGSTIKLIRVSGGAETELYTAAQTFNAATSYRLTAWMSAAVMRFYVDLTNVFSAATSTFNQTATGVKVAGFATGVNFYCWKLDLSEYIPTYLTSGNPRYFFVIGDSKSTGDCWVTPFRALVATFSANWQENATRIAVSGTGVAARAAVIDADLAARPDTPAPETIMVSLGTNDIGENTFAAPAVATAWETNMGIIVDALHTKWASAQIYLARPWKPTEALYAADADAMADTLIPNVISTRAWCHLGPDETVYLENGDDGATYILPPPDGIHPNEAGYAATAAQWKAVLSL